MKDKKVGLVAYGFLLVCLAFVLGYLLGHGNGVTEVSVQVAAPVEQTTVAEAPEDVSENQALEPTETKPLDLNMATVEELDQLPGIGPELAERIVQYRQINGRFVAKEQIMDVEGIGEKRFAEIEPMIIIGGTQ